MLRKKVYSGEASGAAQVMELPENGGW